jgi:release factor glutamine methyltransferase
MTLSFDQSGVSSSRTQPARTKTMLERVLHFLAYHFILSRRSIRRASVAGLDLTVRPTVFDPRFFLTSTLFAEFVLDLDLRGKRVADIGTGSGILAIAAAKAGAAEVIAVDINPNAVASTNENAKSNHVDTVVKAMTGHLLSPVPASYRFDVILSNPPFFEGQPRDLADRAWYAGPKFQGIAALFEQASQRLAPDGRVYLALSSSCDLAAFTSMIESAGMTSRLLKQKWFVFESIILYELRHSTSAHARRSPEIAAGVDATVIASAD